MELSLIGLQNAGKTSLVNVIAVSKPFMRGVNFFLKNYFPLFRFDADGKISVLELISRLVDTVKIWSQRCVIFVSLDLLFASNFRHRKMSISLKTFHCIATSFCIIHLFGHLTLGISFYPQVGFNMRKVTKGNVTIKLWDLGGQPRFRSMWERYCRAVSAIVYDPFLFP